MPAAYQDQNGKWWKECSSTKQLFGGVDTKEELGEWFYKNETKSNGFDSQCIEYTKIYLKEYRANNKSKAKEYQKEYREKNKQQLKEQKKIYYKKNVTLISERDKRYKKTPAGMFVKYKKSAKERNINFTLTLEWFKEQMTKPEFNFCYYSGINFVDQPNHAFSRSLDRISSTKGYTPDNVKWVCHKLNAWKSDLTLNEVAIMFKAMAEHHNVDPFEVLKKVA